MTMQNSSVFNFLKTLPFLALLLNATLFGNALTQYRLYGIKNLEKQMDFDLTQQSYWYNIVKNRDTRFGYIEAYENILLCDKSKSTLSLYMKDAKENYTLTKTYNAYTGKVKGDKAREGDLRTPVGIYNITKKLSKVDSFYGPMAFVTSYPNLYDRYLGKNGSGIWIHGLPTEQERDKFTKGCIAINNPSIECLDRNIDINKTVLIIQEQTKDETVSKQALTEILSQLYEWRYAWIYNELEEYLSFYDDAFKRFNGANLESFKRYKKRVFQKAEKKTIRFNDINVIPYPEHENMYEITFYEFYKSNSFTFTGKKTLIIKLVNHNVKIITEQ